MVLTDLVIAVTRLNLWQLLSETLKEISINVLPLTPTLEMVNCTFDS